ncbi:tetratricopeptide repeat protein [Treponema sp. OMZ 788]|uniref:tetratricopeptide repeat protein n=1 Tax=Treponema sp. OMZ 788 TaxID=2563664 RepID=UPI0020A587A9|nr:tetratricopeptide repeat protein [Treponema sp. OMZ 788]UTC65166.1 tetratricopeptide repeat protein [Treponema sp. OMZ 788]
MVSEENKDLAQKINDFLVQYRKIVLGVLVCILAAVAVTIVWFVTVENSRKTSIIGVEKVIYELEEFKREDKAKNPSAEDPADQSEKQVSEAVKGAEDKAIEELKALGSKYSSSYAGFRANTAIAEIYFQRKMYEDALKFYELAAGAVKNTYAEGVASFNAAACADELGDKEKALSYYERASKVENFPLIPRAIFNAGRLYEALDKKEDAVHTYNRLLEKYPQNEWALLAKSRIIVITGSDNQ